VVLTGRGVVSPLGIGLAEHWRGLREGRSAIGPVENIAELGLPASRGARVSPDSIQPHLARLPKKQQKLYNRATLLGMLGAALAMEDAGLEPGAGAPGRFGVLLGVNPLALDLAVMTDYLVAAESTRAPGTLDTALANAFCMRNINPLDFSLKTLPNLAAGHLAIAHDAQGFCRAMIEGPVGGARAVGDAYRLIAEGDLDAALCGGADAMLEGLYFATHCAGGFLGMDDGRPGLVPGEGSGLMVLEERERARARQAAVHGEVVGFAAGAGGGRAAPGDDAHGLARRLTRVIEAAIDEAGDFPDVVSLHADGLPAHDEAEERALDRALGDRAARTPRLRMKALHADLGSAGPAVELLACSMALGHATLPDGIAGSPSLAAARLQYALVVSLGLFGESAALMLRSSRNGHAD